MRSKQRIRILIVSSGVLLAVMLMYSILRLLPGFGTWLSMATKLFLLLGSSFALLALSAFSMLKIFKSGNYRLFVQACFGFISGVLLAVLVDDFVRRPNLVLWLTNPGLIEYIASLAAGVTLAEIATWVRKSGHPILVFLASGVALILIEVSTLRTSEIELSLLLVFLLGMTAHQMLRSNL